MKLTPAIAIARETAGYHPPVKPAICCANCGAVRFFPSMRRCYYCRRHDFYVHSRGVCPKFDTTPYNPPTANIRRPRSS